MHTDEQIVELGARAQFDAAGHVRYGRSAPDWDRHLTEQNREQGRAEFREFLSRLREAGLVLEQGWRFDMENAPRDGSYILAYIPWLNYAKPLFWATYSGTWWACPASENGPQERWEPIAWRPMLPLPTPPATGGET